MANEEARPRRVQRRSQSREDRRQRSTSRKTRRRIVYTTFGGAVALALIIGLFLPGFGDQAQTPSLPDQGAAVGAAAPIQEAVLVADGAPHDAYSTTPPNSGFYSPTLAPWGVSDDPVPDERVVANLRQGAVAVSHNLQDPGEAARLREVVEALPGYPACVVMRPYDALAPGAVVLTAWGRILEAQGVDDADIPAFFDAHRNDQAPSFVGNDCGAGGA